MADGLTVGVIRVIVTEILNGSRASLSFLKRAVPACLSLGLVQVAIDAASRVETDHSPLTAIYAEDHVVLLALSALTSEGIWVPLSVHSYGEDLFRCEFLGACPCTLEELVSRLFLLVMHSCDGTNHSA